MSKYPVCFRSPIFQNIDSPYITELFALNEYPEFHKIIITVESHYLEIQGTLQNTSRYPYFNISDLQN